MDLPIGPIELWSTHGSANDTFIQLTEGVMPSETLEPEEIHPLRAARMTHARDHVTLEWDPPEGAFRVGARWPGTWGEHFTGLGARHCLPFDQSGRVIRLGADRRYTGPDCPPEMLDVGGIPQGDYVPVPWLVSSAGYSLWLETLGDGALFELGFRTISVSARAAAGPFRLHVFTASSPAARLRDFLRLTGLPALLPEWAYGHWKSRDVYEHQRDVEDDYEGYRRNGLPLDAIVIDSPWETQYNTWEFNPHQFPDAPGMIARFRDDGVRTVVWVTPWTNIESVDGQRPPDSESERLHHEPASNYADGEQGGHFVKGADGGTFVARWWMGTGSPIDFTSAAADDWWRSQARRVLELGVEGIKADDGEGYYFPPGVQFADGRTGAEAAWAYGQLYRESMQRALDEVHPETGVLFGRSGFTGQQAIGMTWGGDQASDFWSLRALVTATLTAAATGYSNWSHDVGGYLGERLVERCPKELLVRWLQFGCFTPLMQSHGRFQQEAWTYDLETLKLYRRYTLLHEQLVPYTRAAALTAARTGLPIIRPLMLVDPSDARGWTIADAYAYGPSLWVAPVLEAGARARDVPLPHGEWVDWWTGEQSSGGAVVQAAAKLSRVPLWVRSGSIVVTYPAEHVAAGLGDTPEDERPLVATLWGEPIMGRALARLADGTRIRWRDGEWSVSGGAPGREVRFDERL